MAAWVSRYMSTGRWADVDSMGWRCIVLVWWSKVVEDRAGTVRVGDGTWLKGRVRHGCLKYTQKHAVAVEL